MNKKNLRIGIVGCGALTRVFYLPVLKKLALPVAAVFDPYAKDIDELSKNFNIQSIAASIDEFAASIDMAIIASPNFLHVSQAKDLLTRGKHVLLEKPIAASEDDVRELISAANSSQLVLQPAMMRRFWKINKAAKKMMDDQVLGKIGTILMQEGGVLNWPVESAALFNPHQSLGGVFIDTGSHTLDLLCWWTGEQDFELQYEDDNHGGVEADCNLEVKLKNSGIKAQVKLSRIRKMPNEFLLTGSKGWIKIKPWGNIFESSDRSIDKYVYQQYAAEELKKQSFDDLFTDQIETCISAIKTNTKPVVTAESVLCSIKMLENAYNNRREMTYNWN